jgi:hypothetical protein
MLPVHALNIPQKHGFGFGCWMGKHGLQKQDMCADSNQAMQQNKAPSRIPQKVKLEERTRFNSPDGHLSAFQKIPLRDNSNLKVCQMLCKQCKSKRYTLWCKECEQPLCRASASSNSTQKWPLQIHPKRNEVCGFRFSLKLDSSVGDTFGHLRTWNIMNLQLFLVKNTCFWRNEPFYPC